MKRPLACVHLLLLAWLLVAPAHAQQVRAWLDRDRIGLGETVTLNVEVQDPNVQPPDYAPLQRDFALSGHTSRRSYERVNGRSVARSLFAVALEPRREGVIGIPPLAVGGTRTPPLTLTVTAPAAQPARAGDEVFIEAEADAQSPYVQQAVGYTVRLYYATPLVSGTLDQPEPEGASLQRIGQDLHYKRTIGGRDYTVVERHFLLIPEHSGPLAIPSARFDGNGVAGFFDDFFGNGRRTLRATGPSRVLDVRTPPATAPSPWLPLRELSVRWRGSPQAARAGEAFTVTVEVSADGAGAAQLPEIELPRIDGAQVFADPAQSDDSFVDGRPRTRVLRRFSIVPSAAGTLQVPSPRITWWDVRAGAARTADAKALEVDVAPAAPGSSAATPAQSVGASDPVAGTGRDEAWIRVPGVQGEVRPWAFATVLFALAWLVTLMWGIHREPRRQSAGAGRDDDKGPPPRRADPRALRQALDTGDLGDVEDALRAAAPVPAESLDEVGSHLADPRQRQAVETLQRARWAGGDGSAAREALRAAFKRGPQWTEVAGIEPAGQPLPPLYPPGSPAPSTSGSSQRKTRSPSS